METHHDGQVIRIFDLRHLVGNRVETVGAEDIVDAQRIEEAAESMRIARTALAESVALYYPVSPRLEKAFGFIASTDWETMEPGIHELDGKDIYVNVMEPALKKPADAKLEIHDAYIDIQVLIRGEQETFGWSERADLRKPLGEFDAGKDIQFFDDEPQTFYTLRPGQFTILFPEDGHAPMNGEGDVRKIIVKVRR